MRDNQRCIQLSISFLTTLYLSFAGSIAGADQSTFAIEIEGGGVWQSRNDVQIPNDATGTRFALDEVVDSGPYPTGRIYLTWAFSDQQELRALAAPLSIDETGTLDQSVDFAGETFAPGIATDATYQFNSWRITYRYRFFDGMRWTWRVGFTAKVRDAKIELAQASRSAKDTDVGFVPLLHLAGVYQLGESSRVILDVDALAGGPGRAIDGSLKVWFDVGGTDIGLGYRIVEGGADVDEVYNFALLNYAVASVSFGF